MKITRAITLVACLAFLFAGILTGCGGTSAPAAQTPAKTSSKTPAAPLSPTKVIEPCALVSKTEAEQYIGQPLKEAEKKETPAVGLKLCVYSTVAEGSGKLLQIGLTQQSFMTGSNQTPKMLYESIKNNFPKALQVSGIGDDAFISPPGLHVLKGGYYLTVAVGNSNDPKNQELLKTIGKKVVDKL